MKKQPTVTPRQMEILRLIRDYRDQQGFSPTMQEIGDQLGLTKVTVFEHVGALARKGALVRGPKHSARSLQVSPGFRFPHESGRLPLAGRIAAGQPIEAVEDNETFELDAMLRRPHELFVLQVNGDSMVGEQIRDGDYVICRRRQTARNGETVVALLDDGEATLKKFYKEKKRIRLQPANPDFKPIYTRRVQIQGVVVGVVRMM